MEFRVLGPLEIRRDGRPVEVRGSKHRAVLALLVLHANEVVRRDRLVEELWGERVPANAAAALQNHVSRLRKDLGADVVVTRPWGYVLRTEPDEVDLNVFEALLAEARPLAARERREKLGDALALWRGPALADLVQEESLGLESERLEEMRLVALEHRVDADLELGVDEELVPELEGLVAAHPLRERLRGQLILALYRAGRQAEALETYRETRRVLVEELGIEPSAELRELERAILCQDPAIAPAGADRELAPLAAAAGRWRWPRSPLALGAAIVLGLAGVALAFALSQRGPAEEPVAATGDWTALAEGHPALVGVKAHAIAVVDTVTSVHPRKTATTHGHARGKAHRPTGPRRRGQTILGAPVHATTTKVVSRAGGPPPPPPAPAPPPPAPPPPPPPPLLPVQASDNFGDGVIDPRLWESSTSDPGADVDEANGRLEFSVADGTSGTVVGAQVESQCRFFGNFDASVDYTLLDAPAGSGVVLALSAGFPEGGYNGSPMMVARRSFAGDSYSILTPAAGSVTRDTTDRRGKLRLTRVGKRLTAYYRTAGERWQWLGAFRRARDAWGDGGPTVITLRMFSLDDGARRHAVRVALDNFQIASKSAACD